MIEEYAFGRMVIDGRAFHSDLKIVQGRIVSGWRRDEGHRLDQKDVHDILAAAPDVLVVGQGDPGRMKVSPALRSALEQSRITLIEVPTGKAVGEFNRLQSEGREVAGAFHLTC